MTNVSPQKTRINISFDGENDISFKQYTLYLKTLMPDFMMSKQFTINKKSITLRCHPNVYKSKLSYKDLENFMKQSEYFNQILSKNNKVLGVVNLDDIYYIESPQSHKIFIFGLSNIIDMPQPLDMSSNTLQPVKVDLGEIYHRYGLFCLMFLSSDNNFKRRLVSKINDDTFDIILKHELNQMLDTIKFTSLYYCIERCMNPVSSKRKLMFI